MENAQTPGFELHPDKLECFVSSQSDRSKLQTHAALLGPGLYVVRSRGKCANAEALHEKIMQRSHRVQMTKTLQTRKNSHATSYRFAVQVDGSMAALYQTQFGALALNH